jgi:hypothetical protein
MEPVVAYNATSSVNGPTPPIGNERHSKGNQWLPPICTTSSLHTTRVFLSSIHELTNTHSQASITLRAASNGPYILYHAKKDTSSQNMNFVISLEDPIAYGMLATLTDPIKTSLDISITTRGMTKFQQCSVIYKSGFGNCDSKRSRAVRELLAKVPVSHCDFGISSRAIREPLASRRNPNENPTIRVYHQKFAFTIIFALCVRILIYICLINTSLI